MAGSFCFLQVSSPAPLPHSLKTIPLSLCKPYLKDETEAKEPRKASHSTVQVSVLPCPDSMNCS